MFRYGYNSNGFSDHSLGQMVTVLKRLGYQGIGITLGHPHLHPFQVSEERLRATQRLFKDAGLVPVVETGARYVLDPFRKHRPSLVSIAGVARATRVRYYEKSIDVAVQIGARVLSLWSGTPQPGVPARSSWERLVSSLREVCDYAQRREVTIGFEPEPGMFVESLANYEELRRRLDHPALGLTLDLGHLAITESPPLADLIHRFADQIVHVHIDDIKDSRHEHLPLGEGEIDFPPLLRALREIRYEGLILVELSRHSHEAPLRAQRSLIYLRHSEGKLD